MQLTAEQGFQEITLRKWELQSSQTIPEGCFPTWHPTSILIKNNFRHWNIRRTLKFVFSHGKNSNLAAGIFSPVAQIMFGSISPSLMGLAGLGVVALFLCFIAPCSSSAKSRARGGQKFTACLPLARRSAALAGHREFVTAVATLPSKSSEENHSDRDEQKSH